RGAADDTLQPAPLAAVVERTIGVDDHVPDLARGSVGAAVELAIDDQAAADACRPGDVDHVPAAPPRAVVKLTQPGHIGVVGELDLGAGGAAHHRDQRHVLPRQVRWIDEHAAPDVDRPRRGDRDAADLLAATMTIDLAGRPVDHRLGCRQHFGFGLDAGHEVAVGPRERDAYLGSA